MNYPVWQLEFLGGGFLIAVIAIIHVYIAQFAVGGGLFLVLTEHLGRRRNDQGIIDYVKKHTKFFLLLTMVFGALTGVGIWFTISLLNPSATSVLIHTFVFAWGTEWVFFVIEIVALFIYFYTFDRLSKRNHLIIGWIYFGAAWMSLFVINGIIDFMLTPGAWVENNNFWSGFFNPTFWPALFFRTFFSVMIAGLFGFLTASFLKDEKLRTTMLRYSAKWLLVPFILFLASSWWYRAALPPHIEEIIFQKMPQLQNAITIFMACSPLLILGGLVMAIKMPSGLSRSMAAVMMIIGLMYFGAFEFLREGGRRPYIIYDYMYSNTILKKDVARVAH
ncbi:MAG: cytochrome ubiquinol oxidase subunit I, partial [Desulfobacterales bacterium]